MTKKKNVEHDVRIDMELIHPNLRFKLKKLLKKCEDAGIGIIITEGFRSKEEQDALYAKGRTSPGNIVTNAKGNSYSSQHQWGIAFDIAINDPDRTYDVKLIEEVAKLAKKCKLSWGGDWKSIIDRPHFYLRKWGSDTKKLKKKYTVPEKFKKTWTAVVIRESGINLYKNVSKTKVICRIPKGTKVDVLYKKLWYAKVEYKGQRGYVKKKYLK